MAGNYFLMVNFLMFQYLVQHLTQDQILSIYNGGVPNSISSLSPVRGGGV